MPIVAVPARKSVDDEYENDPSVVDEFVNVCRAVQVFAFPRFSPTVLATLPLYEPEKVKLPSVAVSEAKSFVNCEREKVDVAVVLTKPFEPMYAIPCDKAGRKKLPENVELADVNNPPKALIA